MLVLLLIIASLGCRGQATDGLQSINGTQLYMKTIGRGEPIVVIHGGPALNHTYFLPHLNNLAKRNKVVLYDQRASGKSKLPSPDSTSLAFFAEDIEAIRKHLKQEKINLFAHSWGAIPAIRYCLKFPDRVKALVICNGVPLSHDFDEEMRQRQIAKMSGLDSTDRSIIIGSPDFKAGKSIAYRQLLMLSFRNSFYKDSNYDELNLEIPENYKTASGVLYQGLGKDLAQYDYYNDVSQLQFPVLIMHGEHDAIPLAADEKTLSSLPNATLEVFKKSGHFIFIEENKKFSSMVNKFLNP